MGILGFFTSRTEQVHILYQIIDKLNISEEEKELYKLSIEVLNDTDFNTFYNQIQLQIHPNISTIEPFSNQLI